MYQASINYWAVLVSAILFFALGAVWYSKPFFANPWLKAIGKDPENPEEDNRNMAVIFGMQFVASLGMAFVAAHFFDFMRVVFPEMSYLKAALYTAGYAWLGFIATYLISEVTFEGRSWIYYFINAGYWLAGLLIIAIVNGLWR